MTSTDQELLKAVEKLATDKNDPDFKHWAEQELQQEKHLRILASGKTGSGKSTLLNGIVGSKFVVGESLKPETKTVDAHEYRMGNLKVTAWESPGLQDGTLHEEAYLKDIAEKKRQLVELTFCFIVYGWMKHSQTCIFILQLCGN